MKGNPVHLRNTPVFKLKDKQNRGFQVINLQKQFGFIPEVIIVQKVRDANNAIVVSALLTEEEIKKLPVKQKNDEKPNST